MRSVRTLWRVLAVVPLVGLLVACGSPPPSSSFPDLRFTHKPSFLVAAGGPEITVSYPAPLRSPNIEHGMTVSPERAMRNWVQDRLKTTGVGAETVRVDIRDASVVETRLETRGGVRGFFTNEQESRYDARADLVIRVVDGVGRVRAETTGAAWRSRTIAQSATLAERDQALFELVEQLMLDLDSQLETGVRQYLADHLVSSGR